VTQISNTASIADDGANGADPTSGNNTGSDTTPVTGGPNFSIAKSDGGALFIPSGGIAYTLTYGNSGNRGASGVVITETVPAETSFDAGSSTAGWACTPDNNAGATCTLAIGSLAAGVTGQTATFAVIVNDPTATGTTQISNTASIADDGANGTDPNTGDNSATDTTPIAPGTYYTVTPCRFFDSRNPDGPYGGPAFAPSSSRTIVAAGQCGIPVDAIAIAINVTVAQPTQVGFLRVYRAGIASPLVATLNFSPNQTRANGTLVGLGASGDFVIENGSSGTTHVIVDVAGYFK
jgi:uncharacterized repeat protein (TIGR01451 family)